MTVNLSLQILGLAALHEVHNDLATGKHDDIAFARQWCGVPLGSWYLETACWTESLYRPSIWIYSVT